METRIEIFKDDRWHQLTLRTKGDVKYNTLINRIGRTDSREISHSNTFSLPYVWENINLLGLNIFNPRAIARALNSKYIARYYVENKILQIGFIIVNNTNGGTINVNFIDEALEITDKWGSISYQELLRDEVLPIDDDYATAIAEMRNYDMDKLTILTPLSEVGSRGHHLSLFPNNLNTIGSKFQINEDKVRVDDAFNPYQSRPIFNAKALFDLATTRYGYTPIYDDSVDWAKIENYYLIDKGQEENKKGENGIQSISHAPIAFNNYHYRKPTDFGFQMKALQLYPQGVGLKPNEIPDWIENEEVETYTDDGTPAAYPWRDQYSVFRPDLSAGNVGTIRFTSKVTEPGNSRWYYVIAYWTTVGGGPLTSIAYEHQEAVGISFPAEITIGTDYNVDVTVDKTLFELPPVGAETLVGLQFMLGKSFIPTPNYNLQDMQVFETYLPEGVIAFDDYGQYLPDEVDLTHAAPNETVKSLMVACMHKEGILMNIDTREKEVKFFSYGAYEREKIDGNYHNWSSYFQREAFFPHNTNYGNSYGKINRIGLSSPYPGNTADIILTNQGGDSKYKDFAKNEVAKLKDISQVVQIANTNTPYYEYTNKGLGLVEHIGDLETLRQQRAVRILEPESVINGGFNYDGDWTKGAGWTISGGKANCTSSNTLTQTGVVEPNKFYYCSFEITDYESGNLSLYLQGITTNVITGDDKGVFAGVIETTSSLDTELGFDMVDGGAFIGSIDRVTVREIASVQGDFTGLAEIANVNGAVLPEGVKEWYRLVDEAVKVDGQFLLPTQVVRNLDLSLPVYIADLNGYYIIEEVEAYRSSEEVVIVKLIKLIDNLRSETEGGGPIDPQAAITLQSTAIYDVVWTINNNIDFLNYVPVNANCKAIQLTDNPGAGGVPTGFEFNEIVTFPPYTGNNVTFYAQLPIGTQEGWYYVQVEDLDTGLLSNQELVYLGDNQPPPSPSVAIQPPVADETEDGIADIAYQYLNFPSPPTFSTFEFQKYNFITQVPEGPLQTMSFPLTPNTGVVTVDFGATGFYRVVLKTNLADSPPPVVGGGFFII